MLPEFINTGINPASLDENGFYECYVSERFYTAVYIRDHYLKHLSLLAVAREMHRGNSWVYDHHDAAIKKLDKILAESGDSEAS